MKQTLLTILRNRNSTIEQFRQAADQLGILLAMESSCRLPKTSISIDTPLAHTQGECFSNIPVLVPILRSGLVLLQPFLRFYPSATVGFVGERRNETTAIPELYYINLPPIDQEKPVLILDPMIATGGSAVMAVKILKQAGALENKITLVSYIAAPEGIDNFKKECPESGLVIAQIDERLDERKWIIPGLGDFGDRYFGTHSD